MPSSLECQRVRDRSLIRQRSETQWATGPSESVCPKIDRTRIEGLASTEPDRPVAFPAVTLPLPVARSRQSSADDARCGGEP